MQLPTHPSPTPPSYPFGDRNEPIPLQSGTFQLVGEEGVLASGAGSVSFEWLPDPQVTFELIDPSLDDRLPSQVRLRGVDGAADVEVFIRKSSIGPGSISGVVNRAVFEPRAPLAEVRFLVANLRSVRGEPLYEEHTLPSGGTRRSAWAGRNVVANHQWRLTLDERLGHAEVKRRLADEGGFEVTHTASLVRTDGSTFSADEAHDVLNAIAGFLALVRGQWAPPLLAVGRDESDTVVWQDWSRRHTSAWSGALSPFDAHHPEYLEPAFRGYLSNWNSKLWNEPLRVAIQMYVEANGSSTAETSLFLAQAALELLGWVMFVEEQQSKDEASFDGLRASARLRDVLDWLHLPYAIPPELPVLVSEALRLGWDDGPHAITVTRNALVHPRKRDLLTAPDIHARIELRELGLWYLELALVRLIGLEGEYANRLGSRWVGDVQPLPWASRSGAG